jgi:TolB-like protein
MKLVPIIICCSSFLLFPESALSHENDRPVIVVLDFEAVDISVPEVQEYSDCFSHLLGQTGMVNLISREQRERILLEEQFDEQDRGSRRSQRRVGETIGADQVITGQIVQRADYLSLEVQLIETESGRILKSTSREYGNTQELFDDCKELVQGILDEQGPYPAETEHWLGLGLFSGYGTKIGEWVTDSSGGKHVPGGLYLEMGHISIGYI